MPEKIVRGFSTSETLRSAMSKISKETGIPILVGSDFSNTQLVARVPKMPAKGAILSISDSLGLSVMASSITKSSWPENRTDLGYIVGSVETLRAGICVGHSDTIQLVRPLSDRKLKFFLGRIPHYLENRLEVFVSIDVIVVFQSDGRADRLGWVRRELSRKGLLKKTDTELSRLNSLSSSIRTMWERIHRFDLNIGSKVLDRNGFERKRMPSVPEVLSRLQKGQRSDVLQVDTGSEREYKESWGSLYPSSRVEVDEFGDFD